MGMTKEKNWEMTTGGGGPNIHYSLSSSAIFSIVIFGPAPLLKQHPAPGVYSTRFSK